MADYETTTLTGSSGRKYRFTIFPRSTTFQAKGGVYIMGRAAQGQKFEFCFVGQTDDLSKRPLSPDKQSCFQKFNVDRIFLVEELDANRRAQVVQDLVQAYVPPCNML